MRIFSQIVVTDCHSKFVATCHRYMSQLAKAVKEMVEERREWWSTGLKKKCYKIMIQFILLCQSKKKTYTNTTLCSVQRNRIGCVQQHIARNIHIYISGVTKERLMVLSQHIRGNVCAEARWDVWEWQQQILRPSYFLSVCPFRGDPTNVICMLGYTLRIYKYK